jgi:multidrug resistance efflux pump
MAETMELASRETQLEKQIELARRRDAAAEQGVFVTADGSNPDWVFDSDDVLDLRLIGAADALAEAQAALARLTAERRAAEAQLARTSVAAVSAPAGSLIWSVLVAPGATVARGAPLVEWLDCRRPLIDVPVSEVGVALLPKGTPAEVRIDGLDGPLSGEVVYVRGAAARLDRGVLAAVAGSSGGADAQVLVALDAGPFDGSDCPVGRAAFVDFPEVGPLRRLMASLRL